MGANDSAHSKAAVASAPTESSNPRFAKEWLSVVSAAGESVEELFPAQPFPEDVLFLLAAYTVSPLLEFMSGMEDDLGPTDHITPTYAALVSQDHRAATAVDKPDSRNPEEFPSISVASVL